MGLVGSWGRVGLEECDVKMGGALMAITIVLTIRKWNQYIGIHLAIGQFPHTKVFKCFIFSIVYEAVRICRPDMLDLLLTNGARIKSAEAEMQLEGVVVQRSPLLCAVRLAAKDRANRFAKN